MVTDYTMIFIHHFKDIYTYIRTFQLFHFYKTVIKIAYSECLINGHTDSLKSVIYQGVYRHFLIISLIISKSFLT